MDLPLNRFVASKDGERFFTILGVLPLLFSVLLPPFDSQGFDGGEDGGLRCLDDPFDTIIEAEIGVLVAVIVGKRVSLLVGQVCRWQLDNH